MFFFHGSFGDVISSLTCLIVRHLDVACEESCERFGHMLLRSWRSKSPNFQSKKGCTCDTCACRSKRNHWLNLNHFRRFLLGEFLFVHFCALCLPPPNKIGRLLKTPRNHTGFWFKFVFFSVPGKQVAVKFHQL